MAEEEECRICWDSVRELQCPLLTLPCCKKRICEDCRIMLPSKTCPNCMRQLPAYVTPVQTAAKVFMCIMMAIYIYLLAAALQVHPFTHVALNPLSLIVFRGLAETSYVLHVAYLYEWFCIIQWTSISQDVITGAAKTCSTSARPAVGIAWFAVTMTAINAACLLVRRCCKCSRRVFHGAYYPFALVP